MITRNLYLQVRKNLKTFPAVAILGPRQVGKTTLVKKISSTIKREKLYLDLEKDKDIRKLADEPEDFLSHYVNDTVIIDEIQRMPRLFVLLRPLIDEKRRAARYIVTGSASPELMKGASESLAGRISYMYLYPINLTELPAKLTIHHHWMRGGFPTALTMRSAAMAHNWMSDFITTYIERDLPFLFDIRFSAQVMKKLWSMMAHWHGNLINLEKFSDSLNVSATTVSRYFDFLEGAFIIHRLPPFFINSKKRILKTPKLFILDSGILHNLLSIDNFKELAGHPAIGASWEGYVMSQVYYCKSQKLSMYFYRTHDGAECDLVLVKGHVVKCCAEIKYSKAPNISRGFYESMKSLKCSAGYVICQTDMVYRNKQGVTFIDLKSFLVNVLPNL